jgi:citrate synthase
MASGLEGVVVAQTVLSRIDGANGRLIVRGRPVEELAAETTFEGVAAFLWQGLADREHGGEPAGEAALREAFARARAVAFERVPELAPLWRELPPVPALRLGLAALPADGAGLPSHHLAAGAVPALIAAHHRTRTGAASVAPDPSLSHAADLLRMLRGEPAGEAEAAALDAYLVTVAEHGMNASTFTARVVASTGAGDLPAVVAALSALEGPLHGGAPGPVLDMLDAVAAAGGPEAAREWIEGELAAGRRLMGFGHRVYRARDPRAEVLREQAARLREAGAGRLELAARVEREALAALARHKPNRPLQTNVEFYTAILLDALCIPRDAFTAVFAAGRVAGWLAHTAEQRKTGRLIRPTAEYVGP